MLTDRKVMMIVISSPSGVGKTTLVKLLAERNNNFQISISNTTRIPRKNEVDGKDYYFVNEKEFKDLIKTKSFYEYARVFNNLYGTLKEPVIKNLSQGKDVLFDIDWQGSEKIKKIKLKNKLISISDFYYSLNYPTTFIINYFETINRKLFYKFIWICIINNFIFCFV